MITGKNEETLVIYIYIYDKRLLIFTSDHYFATEYPKLRDAWLFIHGGNPRHIVLISEPLKYGYQEYHNLRQKFYGI